VIEPSLKITYRDNKNEIRVLMESGVYLYRLGADQFVKSKKTILSTSGLDVTEVPTSITRFSTKLASQKDDSNVLS